MKELHYSLKTYLLKPLLFFFVALLIKKNGYAQVTLQSGSASFSLPIFNWQDNGSRLNSVISLNYNSGNGLKVNDVASNVGQGWSLLSGGMITRMQVGEPDDQKPSDKGVNDIYRYPAGYLYATKAASLGRLTAIKNYPIYGDQNHLYKPQNIVTEDKELDYFAFTFNGRTGQFILDKNSYDVATDTYKGVSLGDTKLIITFKINQLAAENWQFRTTIQSFCIKDENGLIYRFGNINNTVDGNHFLGRTKVLKTNYCDPALSQSLTQPSFEEGGVYHESAFEDPNIVNPWTVDGWYLAEIEDGLTGRKISFNYTDRDINAGNGVGIAHYQSDKNYIILSHKLSITKTPEISQIVYPDDHTVDFGYGAARIDLKNDLALTSIQVNWKSRPLSKYQLNNSYFILNRYGTPLNDYQKRVARLCLLSVQKYGVDLKATEQPYKFDYYLGAGGDDFVPPPFFFAKDIWGYYNGNNSVSFSNSPVKLNVTISDLSYNDLKGLCFLRNGSTAIAINPKSGYGKNGLLKQIIYPTGGSVNYEYAQNTGVLNGSNTSVAGVHVSKTSSSDGGYSNGCANQIETNYNYTLEDPTQSSLWGIETPVNTTSMTSHYVPEKKYWYYKFPFGSCDYSFQYPGILAKEQSISLSTGQKNMIIVSQILNVVSTITTIMDVANVIGGATSFMAWASVVVDFIGGIIDIFFSCGQDRSKDYFTTVYYNSDLNSVNPLPTQFKRVVVVQNSGGAGKTVNTFTSDNVNEYPIWEPKNELYSMKQRYAYWAYGLPLKTTVYDKNGMKVRETENIYDTSKSWSRLSYQSCKSQVNKTYSQNNTDWENPDLTAFTTNKNDKDLQVEMYFALTGRFELQQTIDRVYKLNDDTRYAETKTAYKYNTENYQVSEIAVTQSNGDVNYKKIRYNGEEAYYKVYNHNDGELGALFSRNIINIPIETTSLVVKKGRTDTLYLNEKVTEFRWVGNGDVKPYKTLEQRFTAPASSITRYNGPGNSSNPNYKETQILTFDWVSGNVVGVQDEGKHSVTNIYDYYDKYVVASVINAHPSIDMPGYTSFETPAINGYYGRWQFTGSENRITNSSMTGTSSFGLSSANSLTASLNTPTSTIPNNKQYKLSFWSTNAITVNGNATLIKSAPTKNGFTYYEYNIKEGTATVTVSGTATIDELRLYPSAARMRTVAYDPLIGKTAECDENNRITYYEYDDLGRMKFIKDENKNIVKMYEYNYGKQGGCPVTYANNAISEIFTKNTCTGDFIGSQVSYPVIPAGKYRSSISQADADQQAQNELNSKGQDYANTNGQCLQLYFNSALSKSFTKQGCPAGFIGGSVTYTIPARKYSSTDSSIPDKLAAAEMKANGQAWANNNPSVVCVADNTPRWEASDPATTRCQKNASGYLTGHLEVLMIDRNPNVGDPTHGQQAYQDVGPNSSCPAASCTFVPAYNWSSPYSSIGPTSTGDKVNFSLVLVFPSDVYWNSGFTVGKVTGGCPPIVDRTVSVTETGGSITRNWSITFERLGDIKMRLVDGPAPDRSISTAFYVTGSYNY